MSNERLTYSCEVPLEDFQKTYIALTANCDANPNLASYKRGTTYDMIAIGGPTSLVTISIPIFDGALAELEEVATGSGPCHYSRSNYTRRKDIITGGFQIGSKTRLIDVMTKYGAPEGQIAGLKSVKVKTISELIDASNEETDSITRRSTSGGVNHTWEGELNGHPTKFEITISKRHGSLDYGVNFEVDLSDFEQKFTEIRGIMKDVHFFSGSISEN